MTEWRLREAILAAQAEAALGGHQLLPFGEVANGYQACCLSCGQTTWVGSQGLRYSLLNECCPGQKSE